MKEMSFVDMGNYERSVDMQKSLISGDVKGVTIRLDDGFLELLNDVSEKTGLSRQAFMSKVVKFYSAVALADYLISKNGYNTSSLDLFGNDLKDDLKSFCEHVDWLIAIERVERKAMVSLPKDNEIYKEWNGLHFDQYLRDNPEFKRMLIEQGDLEDDNAAN